MSSYIFKLYRLPFIVLITAVCTTSTVLAQTHLTFESRLLTTIPVEEPEDGYQIVTTSDEGALIIGFVHKTTGNNPGTYPTVSRVDVYGSLLWTKTYLIDADDVSGCSIVELSDGIAWTCTLRNGQFGSEALTCKTDPNGNVLWTRTLYCALSPNTHTYSAKIIETNNGDLVIVGWRFDERQPQPADPMDAFMARMNAATSLVTFSKTYDDSFFSQTEVAERALCVQEDPTDGTLVFGGFAHIMSTGIQHALLVKTNSIGQPLWSEHYGSGGSDVFNALVIDVPNGYVYAAGARRPVSNNRDIYVAQASLATGGQVAANFYDLWGNEDEALDIYQEDQSGNGNLVVVGITTQSPILAGRDPFVMEIGPNLGAPNWFRSYPRVNANFFRSIDHTVGNFYANAGYWITGTYTTGGLGAGQRDMYLVRVSPTGLDGCYQDQTPIVTPDFVADFTTYETGVCEWTRTPSFDDESLLTSVNLCPELYTLNKQSELSTKDAESDLAAAVYVAPNPLTAGQDLLLDIPSLGAAARQVEVLDIHGRVLYRHTLTTESGSLHIASDGWAAGAYTLRVLSEHGIRTQQIMVRK